MPHAPTPRPLTTRALRAGAALAGLALVAGCAQVPPEAVPSSTQAPTPSVASRAPRPSASATGVLDRFYGQRLSWTSCGGDFQCARLTVPLDYARTGGRTIRLALVKLPASDPAKRIGSLVINPGGPGGSGVDYARAARAVIDDSVRQRYDVVGFDPRGVNRSSPVECLDDKQTDEFLTTDGTPDTPAEVTRLERISAQFAESCKRRSPEVFGHVGTLDVARDVDVLRAALGDEKLHYFGASYGTFIGATYADLFPTKVGRMVLDGAIDPTLTNTELAHGQAKGFDLALRRFVEDCVKRSDCPLPRDVQGGLDRIQQLFADLDATPLKTDDPKRPLTEALAENAVLSYLYFPPSDWEQLRYGLSSAFDGDGSVLLSMLDQRLERDENGKYADNSASALYAVNAIDRPDRVSTAQTETLAAQWAKEAPIFGSYLAWSNLPFQYWQAPAADPPHAITAPGSPKILVVGTTYDPATPYPWAQSLAKQLSQGVLLTRVGDGHTGYGMGSPCTDQAIDRYLTTGVTPAAGTVCR